MAEGLDGIHEEFDDELARGVQNDFELIEVFTRHLTEFERQTQAPLTLSEMSRAVDAWEVDDVKKERLNVLITRLAELNRGRKSPEGESPMIGPDLAVREVLAKVRSEHKAVLAENRSIRGGKEAYSQFVSLLKSTYLEYLKRLCGYDPEAGTIEITSMQLRREMHALVRRNSSAGVRLKRITGRQRLVKQIRNDNEGNEEPIDIDKLFRAANLSDFRAPVEERTDVAVNRKYVESYEVDGQVVYLMPNDAFYELPYEEQQEIVEELERVPHCVVMEDLKRIKFPTEIRSNAFDRAFGDLTRQFPKMSEDDLVRILDEVNVEKGITSLANRYQASLLDDARFEVFDLVDPDQFTMRLAAMKKELEDTHTPEQVEAKFSQVRLMQMENRFDSLEADHGELLCSEFDKMMWRFTPANPDVPAVAKMEFPVNRSYDYKSAMDGSILKYQSLNGDERLRNLPDTSESIESFNDIVRSLALRIGREVFYNAKEVPFEVLFERVRMILVNNYMSRLQSEAAKLGEADLESKAGSYIGKVRKFFDGSFTQENIESQRFFESALQLDKHQRGVKGTRFEGRDHLNGFFQVQGRLVKVAKASTFSEFKRLAFTLISLTNMGPHTLVAGVKSRAEHPGINIKDLARTGRLKVY